MGCCWHRFKLHAPLYVCINQRFELSLDVAQLMGCCWHRFKLHAPMYVCTLYITKDQPGWGFTVKEGVTTIHNTVQPILSQPPAWQQSESSHTWPPLEVTVGPHIPSSSLIQWACYKQTNKSEQWNGKPWLECVTGWHPALKTPVDVQRLTCQSEGKWPTNR